MKFEVFCDNNKTSYNIVPIDEKGAFDKLGPSCVLIKCDRIDPVDNARGLELANKIADFLNTLSQAEVDRLVESF